MFITDVLQILEEIMKKEIESKEKKLGEALKKTLKLTSADNSAIKVSVMYLL